MVLMMVLMMLVMMVMMMVVMLVMMVMMVVMRITWQRVVPAPTSRAKSWSRTRVLVGQPALAVLGLVLLPHVRRLVPHRVRPGGT